MELYYVITEKGRAYMVQARGIDDAAWTCAKRLEDGDTIIRVDLF